MKEKTLKSYLLFVFDDFVNKSHLIVDIVLHYQPIIQSEYLKYNYGNETLVCHFDSKERFEDIRIHTQNLFDDTSSQYFLIEKTDNMSVGLPPELKLNLFDLNTNHEDLMGITPTPDANLEFMRWVSTITNDELFLYSEEKDIEDELDSDLIMELRKPKISLDDVLDKIYIGGVASLTEKEKQILKKYGEGN